MRVSSLRVCFVLLRFVNDCGAEEESKRSILFILELFYKGLVKLTVKAFGLVSMVLKKIKVEDLQVFDFALFYCGCLMMSVRWRGQTVALY